MLFVENSLVVAQEDLDAAFFLEIKTLVVIGLEQNDPVGSGWTEANHALI